MICMLHVEAFGETAYKTFCHDGLTHLNQLQGEILRQNYVTQGLKIS